MSKRLYDNELNYEHRDFKKTKLYKTSQNYINISVNDALFHESTLSELNDFSNEISSVIDTLQLHKERIDSVLAIYT
jgi:hypothetical protein